MVDPSSFFKDQFPSNQWPSIPTILRTAYSAAKDLSDSSPVLQVESAKDNLGRLVSWAVDLGLKRAIELGSISCDYRWRPFARPTGRYLELRFSHCTASISQVENPKYQPRNVVFRENARLGTPYLFEDWETAEPLSGLPHFILIHGHQSLNFAHFGLPSATSKRKWEWKSENLMKIPHPVLSSVPPTEDTDTDFEEINLLKEEIDKWRKDNG